MTKKAFRYWLLSSIFFLLAIPLLFTPYPYLNLAFLSYGIGLVLFFFIEDKSAPEKPRPTKFYQKRWFLVAVAIPLYLWLFIYGQYFHGTVGNKVLILTSLQLTYQNYFQTKYDWRYKSKTK